MNLLNLTPASARSTLASWLADREQPGYRARQILPRLWQRPIARWEEATDLPQNLRADLDRAFPLPRMGLTAQRTSRDGTRKYLWRLPDGETIESVLIPEGDRSTLCISSQVGCALGCTFCATGRMGFRRNLETWEIVGQVRELLLDPDIGRPDNLVYMGMGEPLHNWKEVDRSLTILNHPEGVGLGARRITVSTVGLLPGLEALASRPEQFRLAVSLHAPNSSTRRTVMPVERKYPIGDLLETLERFDRRITFEYVMIGGVNDQETHARELADLARPLNALVNILPLHPGGDPDLDPSPPSAIERFRSILAEAGVTVTVRRSRGLDIEAACGQLRTALEESSSV